MKFEQAIQKSIQNFYEGNIPESLNEASEGGIKYTPEWFNKFEKSIADGDSVDDAVDEADE
jgi:hypothetical protein